MSKYVKDTLAKLVALKNEEDKFEKMSDIVRDTLVRISNHEEYDDMQSTGTIDLKISMSSLFYHVFVDEDEKFNDLIDYHVKYLTKIYDIK